MLGAKLWSSDGVSNTRARTTMGESTYPYLHWSRRGFRQGMDAKQPMPSLCTDEEMKAKNTLNSYVITYTNVCHCAVVNIQSMVCAPSMWACRHRKSTWIVAAYTRQCTSTCHQWLGRGKDTGLDVWTVLTLLNHAQQRRTNAKGGIWRV